MQKKDWQALGACLAVIAFFAFVPGALDAFKAATSRFPYIMSFIKFAILATFGECIGLRITAGVYNRAGFGLLPRALIWGILGLGIKMAFTIFSMGAPAFLAELGLPVNPATLKTGSFGLRLLCALSVSVTLNFIFAPIFMTLHKITDTHIMATGGTVSGFLKTRIPFVQILTNLNWDVQCNFVFKKTLPLFWVPMHTITFLLPAQFQVLFAALLGVALGTILALAASKSRSKA